MKISKDKSENFQQGQRIVQKACSKPFEQILMNAGYTETDARMVAQHDLKNPKKNSWKGYNIKTRKVVDMKEAGILDPHKVTKNTLLNAASIAGTILLTECTVVDNPKDKDKNEDMLNPMMM